MNILIAQDIKCKQLPEEFAEIFKNDWGIGWLTEDDNSVLWIKWGSFTSLDAAIKHANETVTEKGEGNIFISDKPLEPHTVIPKVEFRQIN